MKTIFLITALSFFILSENLMAKDAPSSNVEQETHDPTQVVYLMAKRLLGDKASTFQFTIDPSLYNKNERTIRIQKSLEGKIHITADDTLGLSTGLNLYLKHIAHAHVSWAHNQLARPKELPIPVKPFTFKTNQRHATAFNYCTFNYSMAWWDWPRWEQELDLLALYGIDHPLAIIGTEELWARVLTQFGYSREEALKFPVGPAYTAWWLMGNMQGMGDSLSEAYVQSRVELQKKILARMKELGMTPIVQGFVGLVPLDFTEKNPDAKLLDQGQWCGVPRPPVLHPDDPLFEKVARAWYRELTTIYGEQKIFGGDLFHEGGQTHGIDLPSMASKIQSYMKESHPEAEWILQGWGGNPKENLLAGLDKSHTSVVELCNEFFKNWKNSKGFHGTPWYFGTIIQYGGNTGLHGRLPAIFNHFKEASESDTPPIGVGLTWESIEVNPVVADLVTDLPWIHHTYDLEQWLSDYTVRRYGIDSPNLKRAWRLLLRSCYGEFPNHRRPTESIFCARPGLNVKKVSPFAASSDLPYDLRDLENALEQFLKVSSALPPTSTYQHDLIDITRQYISGLGLVAYKEMLEAEKTKDATAFAEAAQTFLHLLKTQDKLLAVDTHFMIGPWLSSARSMAPQGEEDAFEKQARCLLTTWFPNRKPASLVDYGWREINGLLSNYYQPRWMAFIDFTTRKLNGESVTPPDYAQIEISWTEKTLAQDPYPTEATGNAIELAQKAFDMGKQWLAKNNRIEKVLPLKSPNLKAESSDDAR